jgi:Carboxypeptidase regulatory-like domain/TonB dependent receptor
MEMQPLLMSSRGHGFFRGWVGCLALALGILMLGLPVFAQSSMGRILGDVRDQSDASIVGATVVITDVQRGISRTLTTDGDGEYLAPNLDPGMYTITVTNAGFKRFERTNVQVEVATDVRIDIVLQTGDASQTVVVNEEVPLLNTTSSTLGGTLSNEEINDLPLDGRNYENLLQLRPGVVRYPGGGFSTTSTNGLRAEDNAYFVDGLFNSEPFSGQSIINGAGIAGDSATILPIDAIQEFNLIENPPAEYGWKPGAIVNVGLKSGTNGLHGTAFAFGRDTPLDARNFFNTDDQPKQPRNLEQFGATVGGPIKKDKIFFFGGYEGQRYSVGNVGTIQTPATVGLATPAGGSGCTFIATGDCANSLVNAIQDLQAGGVPVSPASLQIGGCTLGPPVTCNGTGFPTNLGTNPAGTTTLNFGLPNTVSSDNAVGKVDYHVNDKNTVSGRYFYGDNNGTVSDASQLQTKWLTAIHTRAQVFGVNWTYVPNSQWVNEARFGYNRLYQPTFTNDHNTPASAYGLDTGVTNPLYFGLPRINIAPFYIFPQELGGFNWPKVQGPDTRVQFVDHVSRIFGKHAVKFGSEIHHDAFTGAAYGGARGRIKFGFNPGDFPFPTASSLEAYFAGFPDSATLLVGDPTRHIHNWGYAGFVQDDWRATQRLTFNIGLRYELNTVVKEEHNLLGNFSPTVGLEQVGQQIGAPYHGDHNNFAPRLGLAWDPLGTGKTVVRAAFGITYETINWESFLALNNSLGISTIPTGAAGVTPGGGNIDVGTVNLSPNGGGLNWNGPGTVFPTTALACNAGTPCSILGINPNLKTPYVYNWTLNVQHAITNNLSLEVAYVGNHGSDLVGIRDLNQAAEGSGWTPAAIGACQASAPAFDNCGADGGAEQAARPFNTAFPFLQNIYQMSNNYKSNYNGLQATLTGRDYHHFTFVAGYTYSHSLDDVGANWDFGAGLGLPSDSTNPNREYASSDFDIRHRGTLAVTYAVPGRDGFGQMLKGWELNSIVSLSSPQPYGVMDAGTDVSGTGALNDRWNFFGSPSNFTSSATGIPFFPNQSNPACVAQALTLDGGNATGLNSTALGAFGCYVSTNGRSLLLPPALGTFGTVGRNEFRDTGFRNWDFSVAKTWRFYERLGVQFRAEFFNVLNHPNIANPFGGQNGWAHNDPSTGSFGCGCATPDVAASNPVIGSGGSRAIQLGLKLSF